LYRWTNVNRHWCHKTGNTLLSVWNLNTVRITHTATGHTSNSMTLVTDQF
jgi:hypothetical protein